MTDTYRIALAGNPNSGKTTVFNELTGAKQLVANYPGVTVERKDGGYRYEGAKIVVTDLPGTYSLTAYSPEERIARRVILDEKPSVVVCIADASNLERNLYLLVQLMEMGANLVLALNMSDDAHKRGQRLDVRRMSELLGFPVIETIGRVGKGIEELREAIHYAHEHPVTDHSTGSEDMLDRFVDELMEKLPEKLPESAPPRRWLALKALEDDQEIVEWIQRRLIGAEDFLMAAREVSKSIEGLVGEPGEVAIGDKRYGYVSGLIQEVVIRRIDQNDRTTSDIVDRVLCHRLLGLPFFLASMYFVFWLTFTVGELPMGWLETLFGHLAEWIDGFWAGSEGFSPLRSLLVDGIIGGVGGVIVFLPNIVLLFLGIAFLEDSGYMARAAFLVDSFMHKIGLHGKSFIPMLTGFGCTIPGIMATRTLESERDRLTTILVLPLMSCGARLPIYMLLIPAFFSESWRAPVMWMIYMIGIVLAIVLAKLLRSSLLAGASTPFVMELPPYRLPTLKSVMLKMWQRAWMYMRKAGTVILAISIVLWALTTFPRKDVYDVDRLMAQGKSIPEAQAESMRNEEALLHSVAGRIGKAMEVVISPMGFDWRIGTAMIGAAAAKEVFVAQIGIVFSLGETDEESEDLHSALQRRYTPLVAFCIMLFMLIATPCVATFAVTRQESGKWKWAILQWGGLTVLGYFITAVVFQVGTLFGL